jgi:hypothetical protein
MVHVARIVPVAARWQDRFWIFDSWSFVNSIKSGDPAGLHTVRRLCALPCSKAKSWLRLELASFGAVSVGLFDFLPPTHGVNALNMLFSGAGLGSIAYECISLLVLSTGYFALGVALYQARRMRNV